jgi:hypothetical protein
MEDMRKKLEERIRNTGLAFEGWEMETLLNAILSPDLIEIKIGNLTPMTTFYINGKKILPEGG